MSGHKISTHHYLHQRVKIIIVACVIFYSLREEHEREPAQYMEAFYRMYGEETLQKAALNAIEGKQQHMACNP